MIQMSRFYELKKIFKLIKLILLNNKIVFFLNSINMKLLLVNNIEKKLDLKHLIFMNIILQ